MLNECSHSIGNHRGNYLTSASRKLKVVVGEDDKHY